ncbi:hypothetical protein RJ639_004879 [Escallonia herrerae]|uniref:Reverse transcriptase RNase H-like domain-containing protein n=1 Tax=Escallonia herrerae TaxID=1293975 RepID=A0AA88W4A0_9ASTE|nr:hypothetical protein RJ639_004879 [Escallonia herrerae]
MADLLDRVDKKSTCALKKIRRLQRMKKYIQDKRGEIILKGKLRMSPNVHDHGHTTDECKVLQREIENLITKGHLKQFIKTNDRQQRGRRRNQWRIEEALMKDPSVINTISGGPSAGGLSSYSRKAYARQVNLTQGPAKCTKVSTSLALEFDDVDLDRVSLPHDDALCLRTGERNRPPHNHRKGSTSSSESVVSAVLIREQDGRQLRIYYVRKVLQGAEQRYLNAEKLTFALLIAARKLRPYFQSHTIIVLIDKPLRRILHKLDLSGRLVSWSLELGEFDIHYRPRPSIKGQTLTDFIVEWTFPIEDEEPLLSAQLELFTWTLFVDGSPNINGSCAGLILNGPDGLTIEYALRFDFQA